MDDRQITESPAEETAAETTEVVTEETTATVEETAAAAMKKETTLAATLAAIVGENDGVFPSDTEKVMLRFRELAPALVREGRLLAVFLACGSSADLFAVKAAAAKEQRDAVSAVVREMNEEYWIDPVAAEKICGDFLTAIGAKAAEAEETLCQQADRYYSGNGVAQDKEKAAEIYEEAAVDGDVLAQYTLGYMFDKGDGVDKDRVKAMSWYEKAAAQGHEAAQNRLNVLRQLQEKNAPHPVKPKIDESEQPKKKKFFGR